MGICFTHHNIKRCESDNDYPKSVKMAVQLLINTASAKFAGRASASAEARKIKLYAYPNEEVFSSTRVPIAFPQSSCDYGMMMPKRNFDGGSS